MAADGGDMTFALPDLSGLTEAERLQVIAVMQRAKEFEEHEKGKSPRPKMEGQLLKYTNVMKGWQTRWFILDPESGLLEYFEKEEHKKQRPRGCVHLAAAIVSPSDEDSQTFMVTAANGEAFKLRASDARERQHWVDRLRCTAEYHTANLGQSQKGTPAKRLDPNSGQKSHYSSQESVHSTSSKKLAPLSGLPQPFLEVQEYLTEAQDYSVTLAKKIDSLPYQGEDCFISGLDKDLLLLKATTGATLRCVEQCLTLLRSGQVSYNGLSQSVSSAQGPVGVKKVVLPPVSPTTPISEPASQARASSSVDNKFATALPVPTITDQNQSQGAEADIDHDEEEEDSDTYSESDLGAVEEHKSVILHLLSQLKLGMDLTKVVLPTFILERRSLLEMFADCMAHPDVFLQIPDIIDPQDRMMGVLEWFLTSFHAGRQGSVAKKPYNPIIGETFHCSWRLPHSEEDQVPESPAKQNDCVQLVYTAEQVSHHPPVSAFYFECPDKRMCMNASIYTKSKFMGMSIGVVMVGKVRLKLLDYDEEYVFGLPSAYARSILTVPWAELGDKVTITCEKTNMQCSVVFHTKPFYGGKLHKVTAEAKNTATGVTVCRVAGEWNGAYEFVYTDGRVRTVDTQKLKIHHKRVRPLAKQEEFESRRLWQHVTNALKIGDVNTATEHKRFLEERQREGERHRKETGTQFPTKYFHREGEGWVYNKMLRKTD